MVISINPAQLLSMDLKLFFLNSAAEIVNLAFIIHYFMPAKIWVRLKITGKKIFLVSAFVDINNEMFRNFRRTQNMLQITHSMKYT